MRKTNLVLCLAVAIFALPTISFAKVQVPWTYNVSGATGGSVSDIANIAEANIVAYSLLAFDDLDGSMSITPGDRFTDYTVMRIDSFTGAGPAPPAGSNITPTSYADSSDPTNAFEITFQTQFSGLQVASNAYIIDSIEQFDTFIDYNTVLPATLANTADLTTWVDTPNGGPNGGSLETQNLDSQLSAGTSTNPADPNGSITIFTNPVNLMDVATLPDSTQINAEWELAPGGGSLNPDPSNLYLQGEFDGNNQAQDGQGLTTPNINDFLTIFTNITDNTPGGVQQPIGLNPWTGALTDSTTGRTYEFGFITRSTISYKKFLVSNVVPEPSSSIVWTALGLVGFAGLRRRRKASKS